MKILDLIIFILKALTITVIGLTLLLIVMPDNVINAFNIIKGLLS